MIKYILSLGISILSIVTMVVIMAYAYILHGTRYGFHETICWILGILGAPTTFLIWILYKIYISLFKSLIKSNTFSLLVTCFLYLLQYQLLALFIYKKFDNLTFEKRIIFLIVVAIVIMVSVSIMRKTVLGPP